MCVISLSWTVVVVEVLLTWARDEIVGSEGLGQHFLTTAWLTKPTGIYFHKQGREMFFIPNCLQVLLFSLSSLELEKHANTESASNRNTRRAPALTQAACSGRQRMHDPCLSHLCTHTACTCLYVHASFSTLLLFLSGLWSFRFFPDVFMPVHVSYDKTLCCGDRATLRLLSVFLRGRHQDETERTLLCGICLIVFS